MRFFVKWCVLIALLVVMCTPAVALAEPMPTVYLGGIPLSISVTTNGLTVLGLSEVKTDNGFVSPAKDADIRTGDLIVAMDGVAVNTREDVQGVLDRANGKTIVIALERDGRSLYVAVTPVWDEVTDGYRLGMYLKDSIDGIGTLTYVYQGRFGALGHCISDGEDTRPAAIGGGNVYATRITSIAKGYSGRAGSLIGAPHANTSLGQIQSNTVYGIFGSAEPSLSDGLTEVQVADVGSVRRGEAYIYTTVTDEGPKLYQVELTEVKRQRHPDLKGLTIKVTDPDLIALTGGIVQGMSGSPILQNGKLVGAVTHVVVSDPTVGYGVFAKFMLQQ